jgi:hypothetical protein
MATQTRELSGAPTITFDLVALLNSIGLPREYVNAYTPIVKEIQVKMSIGEKIINRILDRTNSGIDKNGKPFKAYSESYINSNIFKIYKGGDTTVNLKLTEAMQADLDIVGYGEHTVQVGFTELFESQKAIGHITGARYLPKRDFFGLPKAELEDILMESIAEYEVSRPLDLDDNTESFLFAEDIDAFFEVS